ncbi:hypothetical protein COHA_002560 [Chlorella ohadii]|uniref:Uncharacterized protein n=1 Tax=Chlorella ohadii TaxID=2649997 RepID=A0AAD5DWF9_9CHLO|nr:hypothetical protein COHA_002560 [Chlorella ohadii]
MLPWTLVLDASADQFPARGSRYLSQIGVSKLAYMAQTAPTVAGRYHRLTFWLQARETIVGSNLFVAALQPAPTSAFVSEPAGAANAPKLQLGSTAGVFNFSATQPFMQWTLYEIGFAAAGPTTTVRLGFRGKDGLPGGSTQFLVDDVSLLSEDYPAVQSARGARDSASLNVTLFSPQPSAAYYIRAFADAEGIQPDGGAVQVSDASHSGTVADPFTFNWQYAAGNPPVQRWFVVEADNGVQSDIFGPVLVGVPPAPQLSNPKGSNTTRASVVLGAATGATRYRIEAQQSGTSTWTEVISSAAAGTVTFNLPGKGRWCFRSQASNANGWGDPSDATTCALVGLPAAPAGFTVASPFADMLSVTFTVTAEHLQLGTRFYVRGVGSSLVQVSPVEQGPFTANLTVPAGSYTVYVDVENDSFATGASPISAGPRTATVAKLQSPTILNVTVSGSSAPTLRFLRPANSGDVTLAWTFTLLGSGSSKAGNASWAVPAASINGSGAAAIPHSAVLTLTSDLLSSGGSFTLQLTATLTAGSLTDSATTASRELSLGKPLAPTITSAVGGQKAVTVVLSMPQTVNVAGITTQAIRPTKFALGLQPLLAGNSMVEAELNVPAGAGPYRLTYQPATALPPNEWMVLALAMHANGNSAIAEWPTPVATGLPVAVTLGTVVPGPTNVTIRFTHAPGYSQGVQARVRVWNPVGADGKLLASGKEVEETLPAPSNTNAGIIPSLIRVTSQPNTYEVVARIGSTADRPIPWPGRWKLLVALKNAVGFGPASAKSGVLEIGLPLRVGAPKITAGQGQVAVRINQTRMEWPAATNPLSVREYAVRLEQIVNNAAQLVSTTTVPAVNAGRDVIFGGLAAGRYRALATPCGVNGCAAQASPPSPSAQQPCNSPANCDRTQKNACNSCEQCKPGFSPSKGQCTACTGGQRPAACDVYRSPGTSCDCATCKNGWRLDKGACVQCPAIPNCNDRYSPDCKCTKCKQYFTLATNGQACTCSLGQTVTAANCAHRNSDQCSCKTCQAGFGRNGAGGCRKCPTITNCDSYSPTGCTCTKCKQYFNPANDGQSCTCSLGQTVTAASCAQKNADQCSCKTCKAGFVSNGSGGCRQCATITNCESYSPTDCKCTKCKQYFTPAANGQSCTCSLGQTVTPEKCAQKNTDQCSCKTCQDLFGSDGAGGCRQCPVIRNCDDSYSPTDCKCTTCKQYLNPDANGQCKCSLTQTVTATSCAQKNSDQCSCQTCKAGFGSDGAGGCRQCPTISNCDSYSPTDCKCTKCKQSFNSADNGQSCRCSAGPANCDEPEADNCGCAKCVSGYSLNPSTKQCEECLGTPAGCSVHDLNACTCQVCEDGYSLDTTTRQCQECPGIPDCVGWELNGCTCQDCDNGSVPANGGLQCDACFTTCDVFVSNSCDCDTTDYY